MTHKTQYNKYAIRIQSRAEFSSTTRDRTWKSGFVIFLSHSVIHQDWNESVRSSYEEPPHPDWGCMKHPRREREGARFDFMGCDRINESYYPFRDFLFQTLHLDKLFASKIRCVCLRYVGKKNIPGRPTLEGLFCLHFKLRPKIGIERRKRDAASYMIQ